MRHLAALGLLLVVPAAAQRLSTASRQQDLNSIATQLPNLHPNFFFQLDPAKFQQAVADLNARIPTATDFEFCVGLAQLVAMAGDAHTYLSLQNNAAASVGFVTLPISFVWLDDGVFVTSALTPYARAVGAQLVAVAGMPIDQVTAQLGTVIPHYNDQWLHYLAQQYLAGMQILQGLHIAPPGGSVAMTFRTLAGEEFTLSIAPGNGVLAAAPEARSGPIPNYLNNPRPNYWFTYSRENRLLYFRYNRCTNDPANPFPTFADLVLATLDANPVDTFVWDFRGNTGGSSSLIGPLGLGLYARLDQLFTNPRFRIYVAMDKGTFSAAKDDAMEFKQPLPGIDSANRILLIGEPTGGRPGEYSEVLGYTLPGSKLAVQYATRFEGSPDWIPDLPSLLPDIAVSTRSTDFFARHDPVMAAILARTAVPPAPPTGTAIAVNGASFRTDQGIAPGSFAAAFGAFSKTPDQVLVAGAAARIVAAASTQVNFVVPSSVSAGPAAISIRAAGAEIAAGKATITAAGPGIFILNPADPAQPGAVENQDFAVNTAATPARAGSIVQIFATGYGAADTQVYFAGVPAAVAFTGPIAQFPGLWQINAVVPDGITGQVPVFVTAGNLASNAATLAIVP